MIDKRKCPVCGAEFALVPGMKPREFCSTKCAVRHHNAIAKAQRPTYTKKCVICGAEFETRRDTVCCCSPECSKAYKAEWQRLRRKGEVTVKSPQSDAQKDLMYYHERTYAKLRAARRSRPPVQAGWRGQPRMGGGASDTIAKP